MTFNGIDPRTLHAGVSIAKEIPPGAPASAVETVVSGTGEIVAGRTIKQTEYTVRLNIAGRSAREGWEIRSIIAAWARPTDKTTSRLVPTHWPTVYYDAICKDVSAPEFSFGFATVEVTFILLSPVAKNVRVSSAKPVEGATRTVRIGGTHHAMPTIYMQNLQSAAPQLTLMVDDEPLLVVQGDFAAKTNVTLYGDKHPRVTKTLNNTTTDITDKIAYDETDFAKLWAAFSPGTHELMTVPTSAIGLDWRDEWV